MTREEAIKWVNDWRDAFEHDAAPDNTWDGKPVPTVEEVVAALRPDPKEIAKQVHEAAVREVHYRMEALSASVRYDEPSPKHKPVPTVEEVVEASLRTDEPNKNIGCGAPNGGTATLEIKSYTPGTITAVCPRCQTPLVDKKQDTGRCPKCSPVCPNCRTALTHVSETTGSCPKCNYSYGLGAALGEARVVLPVDFKGLKFSSGTGGSGGELKRDRYGLTWDETGCKLVGPVYIGPRPASIPEHCPHHGDRIVFVHLYGPTVRNMNPTDKTYAEVPIDSASLGKIVGDCTDPACYARWLAKLEDVGKPKRTDLEKLAARVVELEKRLDALEHRPGGEYSDEALRTGESGLGVCSDKSCKERGAHMHDVRLAEIEAMDSCAGAHSAVDMMSWTLADLEKHLDEESGLDPCIPLLIAEVKILRKMAAAMHDHPLGMARYEDRTDKLLGAP